MRRPRHRNSEDHNGRWDDELLIAGVVMALAAVAYWGIHALVNALNGDGASSSSTPLGSRK
jgi:hypothetical protein